MYHFNFKKILFVGLFFLFSDAAIEASSLKKVRRSVARLQMELLELKEKSSKIAAQQMAILEPQNEKIESLTKENLALSKKLKDLSLKFLLLEEKLEKYQKESSTEQLSELNDLATVLALVTVGEISAIEPLVLDLINKEDNNLKEDLLVLLLAETQKNQGFIEKSLSYYVLLMSEYSNSPYLSRAIFEASELLGQMGHTEQQNSMLEALKDSEGTYGILARNKLGIEEPAENKGTDVNEDDQQETDVNEDDQQETDVNEGDQKETDVNEDDQQETDDNVGDQQETVVNEDDQKETVVNEDNQQETVVNEDIQQETDVNEDNQQEADDNEDNQQETDDNEDDY